MNRKLSKKQMKMIFQNAEKDFEKQIEEAGYKEQPYPYRRIRASWAAVIIVLALTTSFIFAGQVFGKLTFSQIMVSIKEKDLSILTQNTTIISSDGRAVSEIYQELQNQVSTINLAIPTWFPSSATLYRYEGNNNRVSLYYRFTVSNIDCDLVLVETDQPQNTNIPLENNTYDIKDIDVNGTAGKLNILHLESNKIAYQVFWNSGNSYYSAYFTVDDINVITAILEKMQTR